MSEKDSRRSSFSSGNNGYGAPRSKPNAQIQQLFARLTQEIDEKNPSNPIFFVVDFLCKHYPQHLAGFAAVWNANPELEKDRLMVVEFFRFQKLPTEVASHFTNAGFDTLETLCTLTGDALDDIERFNSVRWLPGHKVRLQQTFSDIVGRVRAFRQDREKLLHIARLATGHCDHPTVLTRTNVPRVPALTCGPNPIPPIRSVHQEQQPVMLNPPALTGVAFTSAGGMNTIPMGYETTGQTASVSRPLLVTPM